MSSEDATKRLMSKKQTLDDAYAAPANFLEIDVINPITHGVGAKRYTDYEVRMKVCKIFFIPCIPRCRIPFRQLSMLLIILYILFIDKSSCVSG